ncbi:hypothetical protein I6F29_36025 [Bradyrhizobium sp. NBAIM16]|uniref:hypothetical protein n=1 Tax=Bradyrhizobium sp. NBAIM16 TaxID=2793813 RepID=UPI001CD668E9|nr:hypothetical protein [Bradyrhizobium sp. NBAIM16]MCA1431257.1 hypothetical protein [Bradyrhizobium sp. NBAIM16]
MTIDTFLGLFGAVTGLLGLFLAYYFYKKSVRTKVLGIAYTSPIPLLTTLGDLKVTYEGASISALSRVYILFWNRGTAPVEAADFLSPIKLDASAPILNLQIQDKDAAAAATLNAAARELTIALLRPGEAITLVAEVTSDSYRPDIAIEMKSADMSTFTSCLHYIYPAVAAFLTLMALFALELLILYSFREAFPTPDASKTYFPFKEDPGLIVFMLATLGGMFAGLCVLAILPTIAAAIVGHITKTVVSKTITPVAWRFSEFNFSAMTMRPRLRQFKKFMDAEYKKIAPN